MSDQIQEFLRRNRRRAEIFRTPEARLEREEYRQSIQYVEAVMCSCGDGRCHPGLAVKAPYGVIPRLCTPGCKYSIGEIMFDDFLLEATCYAGRKGVPFMPCFSYHESDKYGGCSWWEKRGGGQTAAIGHVLELRRDAERAFPGRLYPIVLGERTHDGSLILHGDQDGQALDMGEYAKLDPSDRSELTKLVRRYLPRKPDDIVKALSYMLSCNLEYIEERGRSHAPRVETHEETGLYVGFYDSSGLTGRRLNQVLVLGICHPNLREQVAVMTKMIDHNRRRLEVDNGVLIICRQFRGEDRRVLASFEAERLARKVIGWIAKDVSAMRDYFQLLVGVTDLSGDHSFERIEL